MSHKTVSLKSLQKFAGKTTSFALLVAAAKLFTNTTYQTISRGARLANTQFRISPDLRQELLHWRFLDSGEGFLPWKSERHTHLTLHSDASFSGWGGCLNLPGQPPLELRGLWDEATRCLPIAVKEAKALFNTQSTLSQLARTHNARIDAFVDNKSLFVQSGETSLEVLGNIRRLEGYFLLYYVPKLVLEPHVCAFQR